jgi:glycosyltransferase involved in cell wall biosynthesis
MIRQAFAAIASLRDISVDRISILLSTRTTPAQSSAAVVAELGVPAAGSPAAEAHVHTTRSSRIVICALETYSQIGGLQNFNRRVVARLAERAVERGESPPVVVLRGDSRGTLPELPTVAFHPHARTVDFVRGSITAGVGRADIFVVAHIRLLPIAAVVRCLRPKLKILLFVHGREVWNHAVYPVRWYHPLLVRAVTRVASVSSYTAEIMAREYKIPPSRFRLLPNAVDPIAAATEARPRDKATLLTVTRLGPAEGEKNVDKVIRAVALLRERRPEIRYEIVGEGALRPELEKLAKQIGVDDIVTFLGRVDDASLHAAYARASVFVLPSSQEGFGIVYLEAWQRGLPVVCGSRGASTEIVADQSDGLVVDPDNIELIADRLHVLLSQPDLARAMGERGRRKVEENYLDPAFRKNLDRILDELAAEA